jgi:hypothetical protein
MAKKYTSGELFGGTVPSDIKDIFRKKKPKDIYIEDVLSKKEAEDFERAASEVSWLIEENYPVEDIVSALYILESSSKKLKKVL